PQLQLVAEAARQASVTGSAETLEHSAEEATVNGADKGAEIRLTGGAPLPRVLQTLGFVFFPRPFIDGCRRRYGDVVFFSTLFDRGFVMVFHPDAVRQVFPGSPERCGAG